ncbi:hypothetical protein [Nocardia asiatica]|uniref:hypothetical protein n=1 Tax=Nocardia asiatica TaxID=209252 RepID=UPI0002ED6501|nr:hypothetical protein [Nocardia asiatica]
MVALASDEDVADVLGRSLTESETARVAGILIKASDLFRKIAGQDFTPGESTVRLKVEGGCVRLAQSPVEDVESVVDDEGLEVDFTVRDQWLRVTRNGYPLASHEFVTVTYSHGGPVPDLVRITIAEIAAKVLDIPKEAKASIASQSRTVGPFSENNTYAAWAVGGATSLSPEDRAIAESYRYRGTKVIVQQP